MVERYKYNELDYAGIYVYASDYDALAVRLTEAERIINRLAKLAPSAKELEKELFDGMVGVSHRGGHGLISAELKKILVAVARITEVSGGSKS